MPKSLIPFPWYILIHADDETPLIVSANDFDMVLIFTDLEFALLYGKRSGSECCVLEFTKPESMIEFFEQLIDAASLVDDRPIRHACFDLIEPSGESDVAAFEIGSLLTGLKNAIQ